MSHKKLLLASCCLVFTSLSQATENIYGIFSAGFTDTEFNHVSEDGASYKLGIGYQFHRQWYIEMGYQQLADENLTTVLPTTLDEAQNFRPGMEGDALYLAFLGKASNRMGELFYRVGVVNADIKGQRLLEGEVNCDVGSGSGLTMADGEAYTLCQYDEGNVGGLLGIGFDFFVTPRAMLRVEFEHISGENDLSINAGYVGFRYNF